MFSFKDKREEELIQLGKNVIREADLEIPITYKGEQFTLRYASPALQSAIEMEIARRLGGMPRSSYSPDHLASIEAYVIIDMTYIADKCPKWFKGPWVCYDDDLILELYKGYYSFRDQFRERLRSGGFEKGTSG